MRSTLISCLILLLAGYLAAQEASGPLTFDAYWQMVRSNHPLARQADLLEERGREELRYARGGFDPQLYADHEQKTFDGKNYFSHLNGGVKLPTRWGLSLKGEYDWTDVDALYFNPENTLPRGGQAVLGLELPVARGLFFDEKRAALRQAEQGQLLYAAQARELRNALFLEATKAYWDWSWAYYARELTGEALRYSRDRLDGIREAFRQGDYPAIDTLEAFLQVQSWELEQQDANIRIAHAEAGLRALLWTPDGRPLNWQAAWSPEHPQQPAPGLSRNNLLSVLNDHPSLQAYRSQLRQQEIQRRWYAEQLKPDIRFSFNLLGNRWDLNPGESPGLSQLVTDNYKLGVRFSYPLFLRKERAGLALADIKLTTTDWKIRYKEQELRTKFDAYWQEWEQRNEQVALAGSLVNSYDQLLAAEQTKFQLGESSVFLLNSRQQKLLAAQLKLLKVQADLQKSAAAVRWVAGEG